MSTTHPLDQVDAYVAEVRARLTGLPDEECAELIEDVTAHVREVADEHGADQLRERLGTPEQFGDELRASAGFTPVSAERPTSSLATRLERRFDALRETVPGKWLVTEWPRLEPAWWLLRGAAIVSLLAAMSESDPGLIPRIGGGRLLGLVAVTGGAVVSFILGSRRPDAQSQRVRRTRIVAEVALALFALAHVAQASDTRVVYYDSSGGIERDPCLRDSAGRAIGNLFAFDPAGHAISQFFLTDQAGRPIDNLCPDQAETNGGHAETTYARDVNGSPVFNVFPRAQQLTTIDPQTGAPTGSTPVPPPAVLLPQIAPAPANEATTATTVTPTQP